MLTILSAGNANALVLSSEMEVRKFPNIPDAWTTVTFENTYTQAVPVCTYNLPSYTAPPAVPRIRNITSTSMQIRSQVFDDTGAYTATPGDIHCTIAEKGPHQLPNGAWFEAGTVVSTQTEGNGGFSNAKQEDISNAFTHNFGGTPLTLASVISANDPEPSVPHLSYCTNTGWAPQIGSICVGKHVGFDTQVRANETIGYIALTAMSLTTTETYKIISGRTAALVEGTTSTSPSLIPSGSETFEYATITQQGEAGGNGGWSVLYGSNPFSAGSVAASTDESWSGNPGHSRGHVPERVDYFFAREMPYISLVLTTDLVQIAEALPILYSTTITNESSFAQTNIVCTMTFPDGTQSTLPAIATLAPGATSTLDISNTPPQALVNAGGNLQTAVSCISNEYAAEAKAANQTTTLVATVPANPSFVVTKLADKTLNVAVGETITYTYTVENTGNVSIKNIAANDSHNASGPAPTPGNEQIVIDNAPTGDTQDASPNGSWDRLGPGDKIKFTGTYTVTQSDIESLQ